jgi:RNA polymerase sigma-70 factor, ECF subfamily
VRSSFLVPENSSQRGLVERAQRGDEEAFAQLVASHLDRAWRFVRAIGGDRVDADDVVQEALVMVWRDLPRLRDPQAFEPWLRAVLVNATRHAWRRDGGVRLIRITDEAASATGGRGDSIEAGRVVDGGLEPGAALASRDALARAFARLSIDHRAILALHHLEGYGVDQIALVLLRPVGTVKSRLHEARSALRAALSAEDR